LSSSARPAATFRSSGRSSVFGYTVANDITARDRQVPHPEGGFSTRSGGQELRHLGAARALIVTRDEISDPQNMSLRRT
jgi:2-keto-4-pentenoate hydratase/2-oxohepta-3-ene-1,7-dioic acid hydratase in catechol pathway